MNITRLTKTSKKHLLTILPIIAAAFILVAAFPCHSTYADTEDYFPRFGLGQFGESSWNPDVSFWTNLDNAIRLYYYLLDDAGLEMSHQDLNYLRWIFEKCGVDDALSYNLKANVVFENDHLYGIILEKSHFEPITFVSNGDVSYYYGARGPIYVVPNPSTTTYYKSISRLLPSETGRVDVPYIEPIDTSTDFITYSGSGGFDLNIAFDTYSDNNWTSLASAFSAFLSDSSVTSALFKFSYTSDYISGNFEFIAPFYWLSNYKYKPTYDVITTFPMFRTVADVSNLKTYLAGSFYHIDLEVLQNPLSSAPLVLIGKYLPDEYVPPVPTRAPLPTVTAQPFPTSMPHDVFNPAESSSIFYSLFDNFAASLESLAFLAVFRDLLNIILTSSYGLPVIVILLFSLVALITGLTFSATSGMRGRISDADDRAYNLKVRHYKDSFEGRYKNYDTNQQVAKKWHEDHKKS